MPKEYVDRGEGLDGQNRTVRDSRVPYTSPRLIENFSLPDKRLRRRPGYGSVNQPVRTQALCKSTGVSYNKRLLESNHGKGTVATTPLSYGLIRWQTDYQLRRAEPKTIEFCVRLGDKENLVKEPFNRVARFAGQWNNYIIRPSMVYLLDQTIISNHHKWTDSTFISGTYTPGTTYDLGALASSSQFDSFPLTAMSFGFTNTNLFFNFGIVESTGANIGRYSGSQGTLSYVFPGGEYTVGAIYHVAIVYDPTLGAGPGRFILYINGVSQATFDIPVFGETLSFVGEYDVINGITYATGQKRDIVLLNECTVRGSYNSACKIRGTMHGHQTFSHDYNFQPNLGINPWACSPPRGTAIWDLRIWNEARSSANVLANALKRLLPTDSGITNLKGNWHLNDGSSVCKNKVTGRENHLCCLHHGYPSYVSTVGALNGIGLKLGEGQHLIKSVGKDDRLFGSGFAAQLDNVFTDDAQTDAPLRHRDQNSFSVMIQIMVPDAFQPELNDKSADPLTMKDLALVETRRFMNTGAIAYDSLFDGTAETAAQSRIAIGHATDPTAPYDVNQHLRAYDQTLWSIEGSQRKDGATVVTNEADKRKIPLARGVLTPAGKIAFELFKAQLNPNPPKYFRLLSASTLVVGKVYTITFVQRALYTYSIPSQALDADGWKMEIWLQNITDATAPALDSSYTVAAGSNLLTVPVVHEQNYDISIGASYVNDCWDNSIHMPFPSNVVPMNKHSYVDSALAANRRGDHGPWPVQQRFMSPYQDQPGNFVVSMFRLWTVALRELLVGVYGNLSIDVTEQTVDLIANLEFKEITGVEVPNKSRYPDPFRLGYKGWGMPQGYRNFYNEAGSLARKIQLKREMFEGAWAYEDCLGYVPIDLTTYNARQLYTRVNGLVPFKASFGQQYGVLAVYDDSLSYDETVDGTFAPMFVSKHGLMSEFSPGLDWRGTIVGNRTFLTNPYSLPKVFDGKTCTVAGFERWSGGKPIVYETDQVVAGGLTNNKWYGVALVYWSEAYGIYHVSPVATTKIHQDLKAIGIYAVSPHPDFRVSLIEVYRTLPQETESLAASAPLFKTRVFGRGRDTPSTFYIKAIQGGNTFADGFIIEEGDTNLNLGVVLDRNVTEFPVCAFSASLNERLYLCGDVLNPDKVYFTDAGNPERLDTFFNNFDLPEGSGDTITGMVSAFGAIFIFKPNAIWRVDQLGGNDHQITRMSSIGAISDKSIQLIINPDTGQTEIFFWSQHGPYIFNGTNAVYKGFPLEESQFDGQGSPEYKWLVPSSVVVGHNATAREIICFFTPIKVESDDLTIETDRNGKAVVYNYRLNTWYTYAGTICTTALSLVFNGSLVTKDSKNNTLRTDLYRLLIGGGNGKLYAWGTSKNDGVPIGEVVTQGLPITQIVSVGIIKIPTFPFSKEYVGCWITVISTITGDWINVPIVSTDSVAQTITYSVNWAALGAFSPQVGDTIYLCQPPTKVEYPWDEMGQPLYDKDIIELLTWHTKTFKYRYRLNYNPITNLTWTSIVDASSKRKKTQIKRTAESFKLELASFDLDSSLDAFGYEILRVQGSETNQ